MRREVAIAAALLSMSALGESLTEKMNNAYDAAVAAKERLDSVMQDVDIDAKVQEIQKEVDRLEEEHYRIMQDSDAAVEKAETALSTFSELDFAAIDTSALDKLKAELESSVAFYDQSYAELVSAAELVISRVKDITYVPDWASWGWIIANFGGGWDTLSQEVRVMIHSKASKCTTENCDCFSDLYYTKDQVQWIYDLSVFHLQGLLKKNGWFDNVKKGQIP